MELIEALRRAREATGGGSGERGGGGGHVPLALRDAVVVLTPQPVDTAPGAPTVFVGIIQKSYTEEMWSDCVQRMRDLFNVLENSCVEMKVQANRDSTKAIDLDSLSEGLGRALKFLNRANAKSVRIAYIGSGTSKIIYQALESLIQGWTQELRHKHVQLVTVGDSSDRDHLDFCKWLCLKGICNSLQFYNTMDYTLFGAVDLDNRRQELVRGQTGGPGDMVALLHGLMRMSGNDSD